MPVRLAHLPGSNGSIMRCCSAMRRIQRSDLIIDLPRSAGSLARAAAPRPETPRAERTSHAATADDPLAAAAVQSCAPSSSCSGGSAPISAPARNPPAISGVRLNVVHAHATRQVFWTTMLGKRAEKSAAFCPTATATLRAIALYACATAPSGSAMTVGTSGIRLLADADVERQRAEERHVVVAAHALAPAFAEDVLGVPALAADVDRHVLDDADDRHADLLEHLEALARVDERDVLRRGDDHRAGDRHLLRRA
jgi:hypothetical protein